MPNCEPCGRFSLVQIGSNIIYDDAVGRRILRGGIEPDCQMATLTFRDLGQPPAEAQRVAMRMADRLRPAPSELPEW